jgi:parallel beta-helix repeat protein
MVWNNKSKAIAIKLVFLTITLLLISPAQAAIFTVTTTADSGAGSFRQAITDANADAAPPHNINFAIAGAGPHVITLLSALPLVNRRTAIDAAAEAIGDAPGVRISGAGLVSGNGLGFNAAASQSSVSWLAITQFPGHGLSISSTFTVVRNCYIGIGTDGVTDLGNALSGVRMAAADITIGTSGEGNVISGNTQQGISIAVGADDSRVYDNKIGTNAAGTAAVPNTGGGIVGNGAITGVFIGAGIIPDTGNLISGNGGAGINLSGDTQGWFIVGNLIGTTADGNSALPNSHGIRIFGDDHDIGSNLASGRNVISGNTSYGIEIFGADGTLINGNYIGLNAAGTSALPNSHGIFTVSTINSLTIGGLTAGDRNVISGNTGTGISIETGTSNAVIVGNYIGLNAAGTIARGNGGVGVSLSGTSNTLGSNNTTFRNVISGNTLGGVHLRGSGNVIKGNFIGTNPGGTAAIGNASLGIRVITASNSTIGGNTAADGNVISGNGHDGIGLDADTSGITIKANLIGTNANGTIVVPNTGSGIGLRGSSHIVGGITAGERNLLSGNGSNGVTFGGTANIVQGNYIGTNLSGTAALANGSYGVRIYDANGGELGGDIPAEGNVISGSERGVSLEQGTTGVVLRNNNIGLSADMTVNLGDTGSGIDVYASGNTIGMPGAGNVIAGHTYYGISLGGGATANLIQGNWIGTNKAIATGLGNTGAGIHITDAHGNTIGGTIAGEGNIIAHNNFMGIHITRGDGNRINGNSIFSNSLLGIDIGEQYVFPNDTGDPDIAGNRRQNFPLLSSVIVNPPNTQFEGRLYNEPETEYTVQFYSSPTCDDSGMGEGKNYWGSAIVNTDANGEGIISTSLNVIVEAFASATVTDPSGNTSEFSPCVQVGGENPGKLQFFRNVTLAYEGNRPTGEVIITRSHGLTGTVTANFTVSNDSAFAGSDYTDVDQVVTFLPWEVVKVVEVPILIDPAVEIPDPEDAVLALSAPTGGATLGLAVSQLLIFDQNKAYPGITVSDVSLTEGDAGQTMMTFDITLTPTNHTVSMGYLAESGTAIEGEDFAAATGPLEFGISDSPQTLQASVPILGDGTVEPDEYFWLRMLVESDGGIWIAYDGYGMGVILNDDGIAPPQEEIFEDGFEDP